MSEFRDPQEMEESIEYLRARGVEVELPSDRKAKKISQESSTPAENTIDIAVVKVPWNDSEPYSEIKIHIEKGKSGDQLVNLLRSYFKGNSSDIKLDSLREAASKQFSNQSFTISENTLANIEASVEVFPLAQPSPQNGNKKVNIISL